MRAGAALLVGLTIRPIAITGFCIALLVHAVTLLGDGRRDALSPDTKTI